MRSILFLGFGLVLASPALAQTAPSDAGAKALGEDLSAYFGTSALKKKIVTVAPEGKGYRITFAPNAAIAPLLEQGSKVEMLPYSLLAAERGDGDWDVSSSDSIALSFDVTQDGKRQSGTYKIETGSFKGVYSPKLGAFLSGTAAYPGGTMTASEPASDISATIGPMTYDISGKEAGTGTVDATIRQSIASLKETVSIKASPEAGMNATTVDIAASRLDSANTIGGFKSRAFLDLWAFAVARADKQAIVQDQETLRGLLNAALPVWTRFDSDASVGGFDITSPFGTFSAKKAAVKFAGDGISTSSGFTYGIELGGVSAQSSMMPSWAASLMPEDLTLTLKLDGLDIETPAKRAIAEFDLSKDPMLPDATSEAIAAAFAEHPPRLVIDSSRLKTRDLDMTVEGEFLFSGAEPQSNVTIEAIGLDKVISALQAEAAKDPSVNEVVGGLALAQGFAKRLPDGRSQWIVQTKPDGAVILNGNQIVAPTDETDAETPLAPAPTDENALPTQDPATATP